MARVKVQVPIDQTAAPQTAAPEVLVQPPPAPRRQLITKNNVAILVVIVLVLGFLINQANDKKHLQNQLNKLSTAQADNPQTDTQKYNDAVSKLVSVPSGVNPDVRVLTQDTLNQLPKDNILYSSAKIGDVILLYKNTDNSLFIVIYRPSAQKIILATSGTQSNQPTAKQ